MNNTAKCMAIFHHIQEATELAEELGNEKIFNLLMETGGKIADILDEEDITMTNKEALYNLNHIYGFVSSDIQQSLDIAIKALEFINENYPKTFDDYLKGEKGC